VRRALVAAVLAVLASAALAQSLKCSIDGTPLTWTGDIEVDFGKLLKVYECLHGHRFLVPS